MDYSTLKQVIEEIDLNMNDNAYLAMTSKYELPFKDKLACSLFNKFHKMDNIYVCREWNSDIKARRVDIGIVDGHNVPKCLIELKASNSQNGYSGFKNDELNHLKPHIKSLNSQLTDLSNYYPDSNVFGIFLGTHPLNKITAPQFMIGSCYTPPNNIDISSIENAYCHTIENNVPNNFKIHAKITKKMGLFYNTPIQLIIHIYEKSN